MSEERICEACGMKFKLSWQEIEDIPKAPAPGKHAPDKCPENLDLFCPACDVDVYGPSECKSCRVKQDGQRS